MFRAAAFPVPPALNLELVRAIGPFATVWPCGSHSHTLKPSGPIIVLFCVSLDSAAQTSPQKTFHELCDRSVASASKCSTDSGMPKQREPNGAGTGPRDR